MGEYKGQYIFTWSIEHFFSYFLENDDQLSSPAFTVEPFGGTKWLLLFSNTRAGFSQHRSISCVLQRSETCVKPEKLEIGYNFELIGSCRTLLTSYTTATKEFAKGDQVKLISSRFIDRQQVDDEKSSGDVVTIRLVMLSKDFNGTRDIECIARTKVGGDQCSFVWKFGENNFPLVKKFPCFQSMQVSLEVYSTPDDSVRVMIEKTEKLFESRFLCCKISFIDVDGTKMGSKRSAGWFPANANEWGFHAVITKNFLMQQCLTNSFVTLMCECHFSNGTLPTELKYIQSDISGDSAVQILQSDFQRMYSEKIMSDVKLRVADETFLAHKCVLCSRSPVFLAMFSQDMAENQTSFVDISDTDPKTFASFLKFLYIGETALSDCEEGLKLLLCANKYQVLSLKEYCSSFLITDLCEKNACQILVVADMVEMKLLKASAIRRIEAHASRIFKSAEWIQVLENRPKLATEILSILSSEFIQ